MNDKVEELVEWVAQRLCEMDGHIWGLTSIPMMHKNYITKAKQILSHPDLCLIQETCYTYKETGKKLAYVTPLAEALMEKDVK